MTTDTVARVNNRIRLLEKLTNAQLNAQWERTLKTQAPNWPPDLKRRAIANRWQEGVIGGLPSDATRKIDRLVRDLERASNNDTKIGTRYLRNWGGETHNVLTTNEGYDYRGETFASLTSVAHRITGHHRSGPQFFGVKR